MSKHLTVFELEKIEFRVDEINKTLDLCGDYDDDVFENLQLELDQIDEVLQKSFRQAKIKESGLRVVR